MSEQAASPSLTEVLAGESEDGLCDVDPLAHYAEITPRALAILNLSDCQQQLERWREEPLRLAQAAKAVHLAMQAALTDALAGSTGLGAYSEKLRAEYLAFLEESRRGEATPPAGDFVMPFPALLARAMEHPMEWSGRKLEVSENELKALERLTFVRHRVEHPRPQSHFIEPLFIASTLPVAARLTRELLDVCDHQYEQGERATVESSVAQISQLCSDIQ